MPKRTPTQFRLSDEEREFLEFLGDGSMASGLHNALLNSGLENFLESKLSKVLNFDASLSGGKYVVLSERENKDIFVFDGLRSGSKIDSVKTVVDNKLFMDWLKNNCVSVYTKDSVIVNVNCPEGVVTFGM